MMDLSGNANLADLSLQPSAGPACSSWAEVHFARLSGVELSRVATPSSSCAGNRASQSKSHSSLPVCALMLKLSPRTDLKLKSQLKLGARNFTRKRPTAEWFRCSLAGPSVGPTGKGKRAGKAKGRGRGKAAKVGQSGTGKIEIMSMLAT